MFRVKIKIYHLTSIQAHLIEVNYYDFKGGQTITIDGVNFNLNYNQVYFGDEPADIQSYTSTQIVVTSPSLPPGLYELKIYSGSIGYAK